MIKIDHISFQFAAPDEPFAQNLYADWDSFCHDCFEKVVEECLSGYDKDKVLHEIERLDLNLGIIPEEDFYKEFPRRLREELLSVLPSFHIAAEDREDKTAISRFGNLLFYLEQGYPKAEWADEDFNLTEELGWAIVQSSLYVDTLVKLCMSKEYALCWLLWQTDDQASLLLLYAAALSEQTFGQYEKRRFLGRFLETKPGIPVCFTHKAAGDTELYGMADLLDTVYVRQIMETEAEEHAEVDLPPYWYYLYEWLIRYYPFNGLAIFGGKGEFTRHLHFRLLTFIRGRNYSYYLSKAELTRSFLLEVFGPAYYIEVLNAIYSLQPHHPDGSPVFDDYFSRELYRIFLQLSLLQMHLIYQETTGLEDMTVSPNNKHEHLLKLVVEKPQEWIRLLRKLPADNKIVSLVVPHLSAPQLLQSMERTDFRQASVLSQTVEWIQQKADNLAILTGNNILLSTALAKALLLYMQDKDTLGGRALTESETVDKFLSYLYLIYTGKPDYRNNEEWADLSGKIAADMKIDSQQETQDKKIADALLQQNIGDTLRLPIERIADSTLPENIRRRWLYRYLRSQPKELLDYIRQSVEHNILPLSKWLEWLEIKDWMRLAANLSLSKAELLQQIIDGLSESNRIKEADLCTALATCLIKNRTEEWIYNNKEEAVHSFVQSLPSQQEKTNAEKEKTAKLITIIINSMKPENYSQFGEENKVPENLVISNAGLCLFSPWMPRLFAMFDYLDDNRRMFKDTASQIRAVFLIQYLVRSEENEHRETELMFNRLLVNLPMNIPLPRSLELTDNEKRIAQDMMDSVKTNWSKMRNTSLKGFQETFINRTGRLEQQDRKWVLTVDRRPYDILLNSLPWSFSQIRYSWMEKYIEVIWSGKQGF